MYGRARYFITRSQYRFRIQGGRAYTIRGRVTLSYPIALLAVQLS